MPDLVVGEVPTVSDCPSKSHHLCALKPEYPNNMVHQIRRFLGLPDLAKISKSDLKDPFLEKGEDGNSGRPADPACLALSIQRPSRHCPLHCNSAYIILLVARIDR